MQAEVFRAATAAEWVMWRADDAGKAKGQMGHNMEKRQLFLRSYHFSRKKSGMVRVRALAVRVRRRFRLRLIAVWLRLRRLPRLLWHRTKRACLSSCGYISASSSSPSPRRSRKRRLQFHRLGPFSSSAATATTCW